jgi:isocitrate dehydrogenase
LAAAFSPIAEKLAAAEQDIVAELNAVQGHPVDIGGYYHPDAAKVTAVMRPSATLNAVIDAL